MFLGGTFHVYDTAGALAFYCSQKAFKLKEDIRIYSDEARTREVLYLQARDIVDFSASYDVYDQTSGEKIGALKRKGFRSLISDHWILMDDHDREIGTVDEQHWVIFGLLRNIPYLGILFLRVLPQHFVVNMADQPVCSIRQNMNPLVLRLEIDFAADQQSRFDRRLGLALGILLCAIEQRED